MAYKRSSTAVWHGSGPKGSGTVTSLSGALKDQPYSAFGRFESEDGKAGTNPEELIAAAHSSCFTLALGFQLTRNNFEATELKTVATVTLEKQDIGWTITNIHLDVEGQVPNITAEQFATFADNAKKGCPISRLLAGNNITMSAKLV